MRTTILLCFAAIGATLTSLADKWTFVGTVAEDGTWPKWSDVSNWKLNDQPATKLPPEKTDVEWGGFYDGQKIDLDGLTISSKFNFSQSGTKVSLSNGTWNVDTRWGFGGPASVHLYAGCTLVAYCPNGSQHWGHPMATATFNVHSGARFELTGYHWFDTFTVNVDDGGTYVHNCRMGMCCNRAENSYRINAATGARVEFPIGVTIESQSYGGGYMWMKLASGSTTLFGDDITSPSGRDFFPRIDVADGATLIFTNSVPFTHIRTKSGSSSAIAENATIQVVVDKGVEENLNAIPFRSNVTVNKTGTGCLVCPTNTTASINLLEGTLLAPYPRRAAGTISGAAGTHLTVTADQVYLGGYTGERVVQIATEGLNPFLPTLLFPTAEAAREALTYTTIPKGLTDQADGRAVWLVDPATDAGSSLPTFASTQTTDYLSPTAWSTGAVPEGEGISARIYGDGVEAIIASEIPTLDTLGVLGGATLAVAADVPLPNLYVATRGTLDFRASATASHTLALMGGKTLVSEAATLRLPATVRLGDAALENRGRVEIGSTQFSLEGRFALTNEVGGTLVLGSVDSFTAPVQYDASFNIYSKGHAILNATVDYGSWRFADGATFTIDQSPHFLAPSAVAEGTLTIEVPEGASFDPAAFTFADGAQLVKRGAGSIGLLPAAVTAPVTIAEGSLVWRTKDTILTLPEQVTMAPGTHLELAAGGLTLGSLPTDIFLTDNTSALSELTAFGPIDLLRCASAAEAQAVFARFRFSTAIKAYIAEDDPTLIRVRSNIFFDGGPDGTITDLQNPDGWSCGFVPKGAVGTITAVSCDTFDGFDSVFSDLTLASGANLRVTHNCDLPKLTIDATSSLTLGNGTATLDIFLTNGLNTAVSLAESGAVQSISRLSVETNATVLLHASPVLANLDLTVNGTLRADGDICLGRADGAQTNYFGLAMDGGSLITTNGGIHFFCPVLKSTGVTIPLHDNVLRNATLKRHNDKKFSFGTTDGTTHNPTNVPVRFVLDNTLLTYYYGGWNYIGGGVTIECINGGGIYHPNAQNAEFTLALCGLARLIFGTDSWCHIGASCSGGSVGNGKFYGVSMPKDFSSIILSNAWFGAYHFEGHDTRKPTIEIYGDCIHSNTYYSWNYKDAFYAARRLRFHDGATLQFVTDNTNDIGLGIPSEGDGSISFRPLPPKTYRHFNIKSSANTATGTLSVSPDRPNAYLRLTLNAAWAGTVIGRNVFCTNTTAAGRYATNTLGSVQLVDDGIFRLYLGEKGACDRITFTGAGFTGTGTLYLKGPAEAVPYNRYTIASVLREANALPATVSVLDLDGNPIKGVALTLEDDPANPDRQLVVLKPRGMAIIIY